MTALRHLACRARAADEEGSVLILAIGYALLAIALVLVCVDATSLLLTQKRADAVADAAALAAADGFVIDLSPGGAAMRLDHDRAEELATELVAASAEASLVSVATPDGSSARVTVSMAWHPPVLSLFAPDTLTLEATATTRTILR